MTLHFGEMWLVQGAVDCSIDDAVEQISRLLVNVLQVEAAAVIGRGLDSTSKSRFAGISDETRDERGVVTA